MHYISKVLPDGKLEVRDSTSRVAHSMTVKQAMDSLQNGTRIIGMAGCYGGRAVVSEYSCLSFGTEAEALEYMSHHSDVSIMPHYEMYLVFERKGTKEVVY